MRISFQRGDIKNLITTGVIYFAAVFFLPTLLPQTLSVHLRLNIALGLSILATVIMFFIASKSHNDIDRGKRESNIYSNRISRVRSDDASARYYKWIITILS